MKAGTLEICRKYLFANPEDGLPDQVRDRVIRIRQAYTHWYEFPMLSETEIRDFIMRNGAVESSQAYQDIQVLKILLGDIKNAGKEWHRHRVISMVMEAFDLAKELHDPKAMIMAADKLGKYTRLDKEDAVSMPWDEIIPLPVEPTNDPRVLGLKPIPDIKGKIQKMLEKYGAEIDEAVVEVEPPEINQEDNADE